MEGNWQNLLAVLRNKKFDLAAEIELLNQLRPPLSPKVEADQNAATTEIAIYPEETNRTKLARLSQKLLRLYARIHQIQTGTFDDQCHQCARPIGLTRLLKAPTTTICADCALAKRRQTKEPAG